MKLPNTKSAVPLRLRALRWNEVVTNGDFVEDGSGGFKSWEGPLGFQADSFLVQVYRRDKSPLPANKKPSRTLSFRKQSPDMKVCLVGS
jgi:hypothetical protein